MRFRLSLAQTSNVRREPHDVGAVCQKFCTFRLRDDDARPGRSLDRDGVRACRVDENVTMPVVRDYDVAIDGQRAIDD